MFKKKDIKNHLYYYNCWMDRVIQTSYVNTCIYVRHLHGVACGTLRKQWQLKLERLKLEVCCARTGLSSGRRNRGLSSRRRRRRDRRKGQATIGRVINWKDNYSTTQSQGYHLPPQLGEYHLRLTQERLSPQTSQHQTEVIHTAHFRRRVKLLDWRFGSRAGCNLPSWKVPQLGRVYTSCMGAHFG